MIDLFAQKKYRGYKFSPPKYVGTPQSCILRVTPSPPWGEVKANLVSTLCLRFWKEYDIVLKRCKYSITLFL